jgi:hypothetical protein
MSKKRVCHLDKIQKLVDEIYENSDNNIVLLAVELDERGYPLGRMQKVRATPGTALGALAMLEQYVEDCKADAYKKIDMAGELSDKITSLFKKLGIDDPNEIESSLNNITDPEIKRQLRDAIKKLKDQF